MASEEVIELGSSDEETLPAPKKLKLVTNAMVQLPNKLPDITIKRTGTKNQHLRQKVNPTTIQKGSKCSAIPNMVPNPLCSKKVLNQPVPIAGYRLSNQTKPHHARAQMIPGKTSLKHVKDQQNHPKQINVIRTPIKILKSSAPGSNLTLPSSITVKKTKSPDKSHAVPSPNRIVAQKKPKIFISNLPIMKPETDLSTTIRPQWYMTPEEQVERAKQQQEVNNAEPIKTIEIIIEDSPVKPVIDKKVSEISSEQSIMIDDSPIKNKFVIQNSEKSPNSKKKLEYPKIIEIEIEPMQIDDKLYTNSVINNDDNIYEIEESPVKQNKNEEISENKLPSPVTCKELEEQPNEFHHVYQDFIDLCLQMENSEEMQTIVEKKIKNYYRQVPKEYTESEEFIDLVSSKILAMKAGPGKMYLYIKDIVDELKLQRNIAKQGKETRQGNENILEVIDSETNSIRQRQIRKLDRTIKKLHRAIEKLEEQEVDFEDDDDSVYLLTARYKERMMKVYAKYCQLTSTKMPSEPRIHLEPRPGQPSGPVRRLDKLINKKVPMGKPMPFPDFHDVLRCVREANQEDKLAWNEAEIMEEARDLFTRCGKTLQRRRQEKEWRIAESRITEYVDPAETNEGLRKTLEQNKQIALKSETEVFKKFVDRQNKLNLEPIEIGDKEAEESPVESEDEDTDDEMSLEDKHKRKDRLRRLIHEKARKERENSAESDLEIEQNKELPQVEIDAIEPDQDMKDNQNDETDIVKDKDDETDIVKDKDDEVNPPVDVDLPDTSKDNKTIEIEVKSISNDSDQLESDIDELHLLQKLHSENEMHTSTFESDSDSPIAISDTLESDSVNSDNDVISIENSSYSESENVNQAVNESTSQQNTFVTVNSNMEIEYSASGLIKSYNTQTNIEESISSVPSVSMPDNCGAVDEPGFKTCINLNDDSFTIDETVIMGADTNFTNNGESIEQLGTVVSVAVVTTESCTSASLEDDHSNNVGKESTTTDASNESKDKNT